MSTKRVLRRHVIVGAVVWAMLIYLILGGSGCAARKPGAPTPEAKRPVRCTAEYQESLDAIADAADDAVRYALSGKASYLWLQVYLQVHADRWRAFQQASRGRLPAGGKRPECLQTDLYDGGPVRKAADALTREAERERELQTERAHR